MNQFIHLKILSLRFLIVLFVFSLLRFLFYLFNIHSFHLSGILEVFTIIIGGLKFDISTLVYVNLAVIFFHLIPLPFRHKKGYQLFLKVLFYTCNVLPIAISICDFEYFSYNNKRITADLLPLLAEGNGLILDFLADFWYIFALIFLFLVFTEWLYRKVKPVFNTVTFSFWKQLLIFIATVPFVVVLARGGLGYKPLTPIQASQYAVVENTPLVTNSFFTLIHSVSDRKLKLRNYYTNNELSGHFSLTRKYNSPNKNVNVIIIVLEGISSEYYGSITDSATYTPFLDSIINNSLVFENAYANAERSNKGMVAILSSIPSFMDEGFMSSVYQTNCISGIGTHLKECGYSTSFFHGGNNGTMNFLSYTRAVGIDDYYGRDEFNNDAFFDGAWGIYDEEFLQFFAGKLNTFQQPFFSTVFTLASHSPFKIPNKYKNKFPKGKQEELESIGYTDYALRQFFKTASQKPWFSNTLFIITPDHPYKLDEHLYPQFNNPLKNYSIPIIYYKPNEIKPCRSKLLTQQLDIMPSILDFVGYKSSFNAFGQSVFATNVTRTVFQYRGGVYQISDTAWFTYFDGEKCLASYHYSVDSAFSKNTLSSDTSKNNNGLQNCIKAVVQTYNNRLIKNELCVVE